MAEKRVPPSKNWCLTWFGYDVPGVLDVIHSTRVARYALQEEVCPKTGTPHIQGYLEFKKKLRPMGMFSPAIHWEKRKGNRAQAALYCLKDETRKPGGQRWTSFEDIPTWLGRSMQTIQGRLRPWQARVEELILQEPDDRTIHWYWCEAGCSGKSSLMKYLSWKYSWVCGLACARSADIKTAARNDVGCYILDFSRSQDGFPYQAIEELKNGFITEAKLKKEMNVVITNSPHVVCFANAPPRESALSGDRWHIVELGVPGDLLAGI